MNKQQNVNKKLFSPDAFPSELLGFQKAALDSYSNLVLFELAKSETLEKSLAVTTQRLKL